MPLVKPTFKNALKSGLEPKIEQKTKTAFKKAMEKFKEESAKGAGSNGSTEVFPTAVEAASKVFSEEMKKLANDIATTISNEVDIYIKSATIITPLGALVATSGGAGTVTSPSPPSTIS